MILMMFQHQIKLLPINYQIDMNIYDNNTLYLIAIIVAFYLLWMLFIKGFIWKLIIGIMGWVGIYSYLHQNYIWAAHKGFIAFNYLITWDIIIPTFILIMAAISSKT